MKMPQYIDFLTSILDEGDLFSEWTNNELVDGMTTMANHIEAMQQRITDLNGCCCAYDHPDDVCLVHMEPSKVQALWERGKLP